MVMPSPVVPSGNTARISPAPSRSAICTTTRRASRRDSRSRYKVPLYLERESRGDALRVVVQMAERLGAGDILAVFPEGTTGDGITIKPFHANLIQAAIEACVPIQPVALQFIDASSGAVSFAPSYVDDETLIGSIWRTLTVRGLKAVVTFGEPQAAQGQTRREWAHALRDEIGRLKGL